MAFTYSTWKDFSRNCVTSKKTSSQDNFSAYVCTASYRIKLITNQCTMLPKTRSTEPETRFEALVVKWNHPFHESDVVVVNRSSHSRNPYATNYGCSVNKKSVGGRRSGTRKIRAIAVIITKHGQCNQTRSRGCQIGNLVPVHCGEFITTLIRQRYMSPTPSCSVANQHNLVQVNITRQPAFRREQSTNMIMMLSWTAAPL